MNQQEHTNWTVTPAFQSSLAAFGPLPLCNIIFDGLQETLDTLYTELLSTEVVYKSLMDARTFTVKPQAPVTNAEELLEDIDTELGVAYDNLAVQVRRLHRQVNRLNVIYTSFANKWFSAILRLSLHTSFVEFGTVDQHYSASHP